jgi:dihydroneopterin aldolase/2-amino-4-hydroxy-6-hydroxymethyldihydropteridine diphosphokinase
MSESPAGRDRLSLLGMRFVARHGVLPIEKDEPQRFEVDVVLHANLAPAGASDDLARTVDYAALYRRVADVVAGRSFDLIEALAEAIAADALAATDPGIVDAVEVRVRKPDAPIGGALDTVEVSITRRRAEP